MDNLFIFVVLFKSFSVAPSQQHRVLFWGIIGALIMRGIMIASGAALIERFFWITYIFGGFLIFTGIKMGMQKDSEPHPERNPIVRAAQRLLRITKNFRGDRFWFTRSNHVFFTRLLLVLIAVETADLIFALDSVPAIFAITTDPFVVYTSNVFAILGLRSLYFLLSGAINKFHYLHKALSAILTFVGIKMLLGHFFRIPVAISLAVIVGILAAAIIASLLRARRLAQQAA